MDRSVRRNNLFSHMSSFENHKVYYDHEALHGNEHSDETEIFVVNECHSIWVDELNSKRLARCAEIKGQRGFTSTNSS